MGRGIDNRGLPYLSIEFERSLGTDDIVDRLQQAVGFRFEGTPSLLQFLDRVDKARFSAATTSDNKQIEILFTLMQGKSWRIAQNEPARYILVQSKAQKAVQDKYDKEDAEEAAQKKQRAANYDAAMEAQKKDDALKQIIRNGQGKVILNIYESQHRGSDYSARLNVSFDLYGRSGFDDKYLSQVILDYFAVINSQLTDLKDFNKFLMSESATWLGKSITWTGAITRPNLTNTLELYEQQLFKTMADNKTGAPPDVVMDKLGLIWSQCQYASETLDTFWEKSVSHAQRIALAIQILQMAIPVGGSASFIESLCIEAASKFSYSIANKIVNGSDQSWASTLEMAAIGSLRDTVMRVAVSKLVSKIPKISGIGSVKGETVRFAVNAVTMQVAQSMGEFFQGATFGAAFANLYRNLKNYDTWVTALATHTATKYFGSSLDINRPAGPSMTRLPEGSGTVIEPVKKPIKIPKKPALAVAVIMMFGPAAHGLDTHQNAPTISEKQPADVSKPVPVERPNNMDRGVDGKEISSKSTTPNSDSNPQKITPEQRGTSNATAAPAKPLNKGAAGAESVLGPGQKPPTKPPNRSPPILPPGKRKEDERKEGEPPPLRTVEDADAGVELTQAYKDVGFTKRKNADRRFKRKGKAKDSDKDKSKGEAKDNDIVIPYRNLTYGRWQVSKTGKDYEYVLYFIDSNGNEVIINPDDLEESEIPGRIDLVEYKHKNDPRVSAKIEALMAKNNNILDKGVYRKLNSNLHYKHMGDKFNQMMNYVEALARYPKSLSNVIYRCSDKSTQMTYQLVLDNLQGIYDSKPALLKLLNKVKITLDSP
jgi:hypothetical protein